MEKPSLGNQETWDIIKWGATIMSTIILFLGRWFFGDIRDTQKEHGERLTAVEENVNKILIKLDSVDKIAEYLHAIKGATSYQDHIKRQTRKRNNRIKRLEKKIV